MLLRYSFGLEAEARAVEQAVEATLAAGARTADIAPRGGASISTEEYTATVLDHLERMVV
jgi:3-isopropylmalate dehydrogenase